MVLGGWFTSYIWTMVCMMCLGFWGAVGARAGLFGCGVHGFPLAGAHGLAILQGGLAILMTC